VSAKMLQRAGREGQNPDNLSLLRRTCVNSQISFDWKISIIKNRDIEMQTEGV